jgi:hypothetical protein
MESTSQKPLPDLPDVSLVINLSIDARAHLSKFIRFGLAEESQSAFSDTQREAWALALESVHGELGDFIAAGDWMAGAKKRAQLKKLQKDASEVGKKKQDKGTAGQSKGKSPSNGKSEVKVAEPEHSEREDGRSRDNTQSTRSDNADDHLGRSLNELRGLLSKAASQPSATSATHVLLSVALRESGTPTEDSGFDVIPPNPSCQFKPDSFTLPQDGPGVKNLNRVVLYGLDEWEGRFSMSFFFNCSRSAQVMQTQHS